MDKKKFEQLITYITNEDIEQANALFHDIVVERSREIYESMMDEEDQVDTLQDEVQADQVGLSEEDMESEEMPMDEEDGMMDLGDDPEMDAGEDDGEEFDLDAVDTEEEPGEEDLEDRVVDLEDKLDELMAEFEELMAQEESEPEHAEDGEADEGDADEAEGEEELAESVALQPVKGLYNSKIGGDDGAQTKSPTLTKPKVVSTGAKPVGFAQGDEKGRPAPTVKDMPGSYKNAPGQKKQDGESAPKPTTSQATGGNVKSPLGEGKRK